MNEAHRDEIRRLVLDRGTTWPWSSVDSSIATSGVMGGNPRLAAAELGEPVISSALDGCGTVLKELQKPD